MSSSFILSRTSRNFPLKIVFGQVHRSLDDVSNKDEYIKEFMFIFDYSLEKYPGRAWTRTERTVRGIMTSCQKANEDLLGNKELKYGWGGNPLFYLIGHFTLSLVEYSFNGLWKTEYL